MNISKKIVAVGVVSVLSFGMLVGFLVSRGPTTVFADNDATVDSDTLDSLYDAVFHRPADLQGRGFHLGRRLKDVLRDFRNSQEMRYYGALFKAVKSYEEAQRAPGTLTEEEKQNHLDLIDSALSNLLAWVSTLPDQDACQATVGAVEARNAIQAAYDNMSPEAKAAAEKGIFNALKHLGKPRLLKAESKCVTPTPTTSESPTPTPTP
ncbi:MAG: hypothetical protein HYX22_01610 [Candidatus Yanofskybacteria bacterium]|nr:hypothetical protein [Candidatus Yanofskybacteria bacterium]